MKLNKVLITQSQLKNYSGSEIVTLELAEHFASQGVEVTVLTQYYDLPIKKHFDLITGVEVMLIGSIEATKIDVSEYDIVWVHHLTLTDKIIEQVTKLKVGKPYVVFNHMSSVDMIEYPLLPDSESEIADIIMFNSDETLSNLSKKGVVFPKTKTHIFPNPAPDAFLRSNHKTASQHKRVKICVVSNHPPRELKEAAALLRRQSVDVDFFGRADKGRVERVTPEIIQDYDIVVSIGKTVQYCLVANVPIFCYDRFGGPGYLTDDNFKLARRRNFSGRGFERMKKDELVSLLSIPIDDVRKKFTVLHKKYSKEFLLSSELEIVTKLLSKLPKTERIISEKSKSALMYHSAKMNKFFPAYLMYINELRDLKIQQEKSLIENEVPSTTSTKRTLANLKSQAEQYVRIGVSVAKNPKRIVRKTKKVLSPALGSLMELNRRRTLKNISATELVLHVSDKNLKTMQYDTLISELKYLNESKIEWKRIQDRLAKQTKNKLSVSVIMLVYKNIDMTKHAIESVMSVKTDVDFELIVVDNGSDAATLRGLRTMKRKFPALKLIYNDQNLNFSLGNNIGFSYAKGDISLFLNNDTEVTDRWLEGIVEAFKEPSVRVVQPALLYPDKTIQCIGIVFSRKSDIGYGLYVGGEHTDSIKMKNRRLQAVTGACLAVRSSDFASLKGFDPVFVNGQEDVDLCLRLAKNDHFPALCTISSVVYHFEGKSQGRGKRVLLNRQQFLKRWSGKILSDDEAIYEADGYIVTGWDVDSPQSIGDGVEVYTPRIKRVTTK